jgi:hypothetical protein
MAILNLSLAGLLEVLPVAGYVQSPAKNACGSLEGVGVGEPVRVGEAV